MKLKKEIKYGFILIVLIVAYIAFIFVNGLLENKGKEPTISVPNTTLEVSVKDSEEKLLKNVTARDEEDGSLTSNVFIEDISEFNDNQERTITYAVFDSDDNLVRATRKMRYKDYSEPEITLKKSLCYFYVTSTEEYKDFVSASSSVDGDVTSSISIDKEYYDQDDNHFVTYSVTDSCGTKTTLTLKADELNKYPNIDIKLKKYLKRVKVGTTITEVAPRSNMEDIEIMGMVDNTLKADVEVANNYNPDVPGTYEFIYRISKANGDYGYTKLVVIVEE